MRTHLTIPGLGLGLLTLTFFSTASRAAEPPPLVSHEALEKRLAEPKLRLLDVRPRDAFDKGHIPGAVWVDSKAAAAIASKPGGLTNSAAWEAWAAPLAVGNDSEVLVYGGANPVDTARVWWLLRYLGVDRVGLVDGGFPLWASAGRRVSTETTGVTPRPFKVEFRRGRLATKDDVLSALKNGESRVVDARTEGEYTGEVKISKRGGHVPTACRVEHTELVNKQGQFLDEGTLRSKFTGAGLKPGEPVITHCQGGGRASLDAFVLERLGFPTRNYYLGWSDWGNADETPVTTGQEAGKKP